ncbi:MAG: hypothetical protein IMW96_06045 [Thermoanaerobacteraceae bacterium]|nr:hypothetical protein [Thermoanaerobacteraceae bacterium]
MGVEELLAGLRSGFGRPGPPFSREVSDYTRAAAKPGRFSVAGPGREDGVGPVAEGNPAPRAQTEVEGGAGTGYFQRGGSPEGRASPGVS